MTTWREFRFEPHAARYRWRCHGWNDDGYPHGLEVQRWEGEEVGWVPMPSYNLLDAFKMGWMQARAYAADQKQTELAL